MGGNALAPFGARRYERAEYLKLRDVVLEKLKEGVTGSRSFIEIPSYHDKESYGDLDILCTELSLENYEEIKALAGGKAFKINSEVISVLWEELQVDIIPMSVEDYVTAYIYYSYNDLGNLMGKLYHKFGLKYGHRGLTIPMRDGNNQYDELIVSKSSRDIVEFLGLDWMNFQEGFKDRTEIFEFVISSKYFNPEVYAYENLNAANRIRDRKRETYREFLKYVLDKPAKFIFKEDKDEYLPLLFDFFPGLSKKYDESKQKLAHRFAVRDKFNGGLVSEWTGLTGKELGQFMEQVRHSRGEFSKWVLNWTDEELKALVLDEFRQFIYIRDQ